MSIKTCQVWLIDKKSVRINKLMTFSNSNSFFFLVMNSDILIPTVNKKEITQNCSMISIFL